MDYFKSIWWTISWVHVGLFQGYMVDYVKGTWWVLYLSKRHCMDAVGEQEAKAVFEEETCVRIQIGQDNKHGTEYKTERSIY